jgi:hypothetical protein
VNTEIVKITETLTSITDTCIIFHMKSMSSLGTTDLARDSLTGKALTGVLLAIPALAGFVSLASLALGVVDSLVLAILIIARRRTNLKVAWRNG